jgi:hypothetical protein
VFELSSKTLPSDKARTLLRRLRDLNLQSGPVAVTRELGVVIAGCLSLDGPAEAGVRYRLRMSDGRDGRLEIGFRGACMTLSLVDPTGAGPTKAAATSAPARNLEVDVTCDRRGRACAREIGARVMPESNDARELEHFLRRVVRAVVAREA